MQTNTRAPSWGCTALQDASASTAAALVQIHPEGCQHPSISRAQGWKSLYLTLYPVPNLNLLLLFTLCTISDKSIKYEMWICAGTMSISAKAFIYLGLGIYILTIESDWSQELRQFTYFKLSARWSAFWASAYGFSRNPSFLKLCSCSQFLLDFAINPSTYRRDYFCSPLIERSILKHVGQSDGKRRYWKKEKGELFETVLLFALRPQRSCIIFKYQLPHVLLTYTQMQPFWALRISAGSNLRLMSLGSTFCKRA